MHIVTGASGFIGSNMVQHLNRMGHNDILCVDTLNSEKVKNLQGLQFIDFISPSELLTQQLDDCTLWHLGANSKTSSDDWESIYNSNVVYTRKLLSKFNDVVFASSASVYGDNTDTSEHPDNESPKNMYAATKMMCDNMIRSSQTGKRQSWRFFNVYGNRESHKIEVQQASPYTNFIHQAKTTGVIKLFTNSKDVFRDFICIDDVVSIMYDVHERTDNNFISNLGTGKVFSFQQWGELLANKYNAEIEYIEMPDSLKNIYQMYTCSDNEKLGHLLDYIWEDLRVPYQFLTPEEYIEDNL